MSDDEGPDTITVTRNQGIAVALLFGLLIGFSGNALISGSNSLIGNFMADNPSQNNTAPKVVDVSKIETEGEPVLGQEDANVTMVVYEDFQCPYCQRFEQNAVEKIKSNYVESGKVRIIWKDYPIPSLGHDWAVPAAETMECGYRQSNQAFWDVKETIFDNHNVLNSNSVDAQEEIIAWLSAKQSINETKLRSCVQNKSAQEEVNEDLKEGQSFDAVVEVAYPSGPKKVNVFSGTPGTVIYGEGDETGEPVVGAQPYSVFKNIIESKMPQ